MTGNQLRTTLQAAPFRPFLIRMADGRSFEVRHPDFLLIGPDNRTAFVFAGPTVFDFSIIDVMLMTEIEMIQQGPPSTADAAAG